MYGIKPCNSPEAAFGAGARRDLYGSVSVSRGRKKSPPRSPMSGLLASEVRFAYCVEETASTCDAPFLAELPVPRAYVRLSGVVCVTSVVLMFECDLQPPSFSWVSCSFSERPTLMRSRRHLSPCLPWLPLGMARRPQALRGASASA